MIDSDKRLTVKAAVLESTSSTSRNLPCGRSPACAGRILIRQVRVLLMSEHALLLVLCNKPLTATSAIRQLKSDRKEKLTFPKLRFCIILGSNVTSTVLSSATL